MVAIVGGAGCARQGDMSEIRREQRSIRTQLADTRATVDSLQREIATTRGKVQENRHAERADTRFQTLEARVAAIEQGHPGAAVESGAPIDVGEPQSGTQASAAAAGAAPAPEAARACSAPAASREGLSGTPVHESTALGRLRTNVD